MATLALLKSLYDTGTDHIGMFLPLLLEAIRSGMPEAFSVDQCRTAFRDTHGISVANPTMQTVLNRAVRKKYLHRN
ncbi:MAG TPA: hypothetical protein VGS58_15610, partial [Candidatus Sulfopaludibacter sp.]|nr:hypothetical protein [Candidatus Sulfopaludibacter sp.]